MLHQQKVIQYLQLFYIKFSTDEVKCSFSANAISGQIFIFTAKYQMHTGGQDSHCLSNSHYVSIYRFTDETIRYNSRPIFCQNLHHADADSGIINAPELIPIDTNNHKLFKSEDYYILHTPRYLSFRSNIITEITTKVHQQLLNLLQLIPCDKMLKSMTIDE